MSASFHGFSKNKSFRKKRKKKSDGSKALKMVRELSKAQELKITDGSIDLDDTDWLGGITIINATNQGDNQVERIGDRLFMKSLHLRGRVTLGSNLNNQTLRMIVFIDKTNDIQLVDELLQNPGSPLATESFFVRENRKKWTSIIDHTFNLWDNGQKAIEFVFNKSLKKTVVYEDQTTVISSNAVKVLYRV